MDERKNNMLKQNKKREKQKKTHASELENIHKYVEEVSHTDIMNSFFFIKIKLLNNILTFFIYADCGNV